MNDVELENGLKLTYENATRLIEEAEGLVVFERYSRAYTLFQLATEEIGKFILIFHALLDFYNGITIDEKYFKDNHFKDHMHKTKKSLLIELIVIEHFESHIGHETGLKQKIWNDFNNVNELNNRKNQSLYVSIKDDKFVFPDTVITKDMVNDIGLLTKIRLKGIEPFIQPLPKMQEIAIGLKELLNNPDKIKEIENKYTS